MLRHSLLKVIVILLELLFLCNCRPSPIHQNGISSGQVDGGSGRIQFPFVNRDYINKVHNGNEQSSSLALSPRVVKSKRSLAGGDSNTPDFKSLVHGLETQESQNSNEGGGQFPATATAESSTDISQITNLIASSLNALHSAADLAKNSSSYLQNMLTTVQENSGGIVQQVQVLKNLTVELGNEVAKPLRKMEPLLETQIEFAQSITSSVTKLSDKVQGNDDSLKMLEFYAPIIIVSSLACNLVSLLMLMCLLCTCVNMKKLRRSQEDIYARPPSIQHQYGTLPLALRNLEMGDMGRRNTLRPQF